MSSLSTSWQWILTQELLLRIIMKLSCHFLFNHLGMPTLQNSTKFSTLPIWYSYNGPLLHSRGTDHIQNTCHVITTRCCCATSLCVCKLREQTENTAPVLLAACVLWALPSNGFTCHNINPRTMLPDTFCNIHPITPLACNFQLCCALTS
jgi:hypothetical protein